MVKRLALIKIRSRAYRLTQARDVEQGSIQRYLGLLLIVVCILLLVLMKVDFGREPLVALAVLTVGGLGIFLLLRSERRLQVNTLLEVDLSRGVLVTPQKSTNGSGQTRREIEVREVSELLYAIRSVPLDGSRTRPASVDAFAVSIRLLDGEVIGVVDACLDHDSSFRVARSLANLLNVGVKQVGKGWKSE
ncbi:MAG: hypothetical protein JW797_13105 [Bradymonadales bacterium]|nr:hypothetical protein [Bradymonadales bacterium]